MSNFVLSLSFCNSYYWFFLASEEYFRSLLYPIFVLSIPIRPKFRSVIQSVNIRVRRFSQTSSDFTYYSLGLLKQYLTVNRNANVFIKLFPRQIKSMLAKMVLTSILNRVASFPNGKCKIHLRFSSKFLFRFISQS